jgi:hypothetical protein
VLSRYVGPERTGVLAYEFRQSGRSGMASH